MTKDSTAPANVGLTHMSTSTARQAMPQPSKIVRMFCWNFKASRLRPMATAKSVGIYPRRKEVAKADVVVVV